MWRNYNDTHLRFLKVLLRLEVNKNNEIDDISLVNLFCIMYNHNCLKDKFTFIFFTMKGVLFLKEKGVIENKVYEYRVLKRLSQEKLGQAVGVSKQTIYAMEKGNYSPSLLLAFKIALYFDTTIEQVFTYKEE